MRVMSVVMPARLNRPLGVAPLVVSSELIIQGRDNRPE